MKSFWITTESGRSVVEPHDVPEPQAGPGEIAIRVRATGLNRGAFIVGGVMHGGGNRPGGTEAAGDVTAVGDGVTGWEVGERVMGRVSGQHGAFAEATIILDHQAMKVPAHFSWEQAGAIPATYLAAYDAVVAYGKLARDDWMLVTGASSAVGVASIQTAKLLGGRAIGTSGSAEKLDRLKAIGLDVGIATRKPDFAERVREVAPDGIALAVNCVGGTMFAECMRTLGHGGRLATVGYLDSAYEATIDLRELHANRNIVFGISNSRLGVAGRIATVEGFKRDILPAMNDPGFAPLVDRVFDFDDLAAGKDYMESNAQVGKIVVRVP